jgi:uncharacterized short protein YbdD (DUF466 family)
MAMVQQAKRMAAVAWWWLRQVTGDAAYEIYLVHYLARSSRERATRAMTRDEFYADSLRRRYSTINRCC